MAEYVKVKEFGERVDIWFYNEMDKPFAIGEKMYEINDAAYMNGYNWDAFFNYYLAKHAPDVLVGMDTNPEAGSYMAIYALSTENVARAKKFAEIIMNLIENEEELYRIVREDGDDIEWD